jgi:hypothetical protein
MTTPSAPTTASAPTTVEGLRHEIERTRAELGETVTALTAKIDVKARLHDSAEQARKRVRVRVRGAVDRAVPERAQQAAGRVGHAAARHRTSLILAAATGLVAVLTIRWQRRRCP